MVQLDTLSPSSRCYAETSPTLLTLELSISPDKVREISNLTEINRQPNTASHRLSTAPTDEPTITSPNLSTEVYSGITAEAVEP